MKKGKEWRSTDRQLQNRVVTGGVKYSTGIVANNTVITTYGARWVKLGGTFCKVFCLTTRLYT